MKDKSRSVPSCCLIILLIIRTIINNVTARAMLQIQAIGVVSLCTLLAAPLMLYRIKKILITKATAYKMETGNMKFHDSIPSSPKLVLIYPIFCHKLSNEKFPKFVIDT